MHGEAQQADAPKAHKLAFSIGSDLATASR
jgi:hypothetical protein